MGVVTPAQIETVPRGFTIAYYDVSHRYKLDGEWCPSVTTLTGQLDKPGLAPSAAKLASEGKDYRAEWRNAADRGTAAHDEIISFLQEERFPSPSKYEESWRPFITAGIEWWLATKPKLIDAERMVGSKTYRFAGRFDLLLRLEDGRTCRVDLKTQSKPLAGKAPYDEYLLQLAGYELAAVESGYAASDCQAIVRLDPEGNWDFTQTYANPEDFLCLTNLYWRLKEMRTRQKDPEVAEQEVAA